MTDTTTSTTEPADQPDAGQWQLGQSIKALATCDRLPIGTIVGFAHPVYQAPIAAVRVALADGTPLWSCDGRLVKTRALKEATGWAPFVILALPGDPVLNGEVHVGYRLWAAPDTTAATARYRAMEAALAEIRALTAADGDPRELLDQIAVAASKAAG